MVVLLTYFRNSLDKERRELIEKNQMVSQANSDLALRTTELELYNRDVETMKVGLEEKAEKNFEELQQPELHESFNLTWTQL